MKKFIILISFVSMASLSQAQMRLSARTSYSMLNTVPDQATYLQNVSDAQKGNRMAAATVGSQTFRDRYDAIDYTAADKNMVVAYAVPWRVIKDRNLLIAQLEKKILNAQTSRNQMVNMYNMQNDDGRRGMEANGYQDYLSARNGEINTYQKMIDEVYLHQGELNFENNKPSLIKADSRFIDPIMAVPLMKAQTNEDVAGGYLVLMDFIPFDVISNLPVKQTILVFKR